MSITNEERVFEFLYSDDDDDDDDDDTTNDGDFVDWLKIKEAEQARQDAEYAEYVYRTTTQKIAIKKIMRNRIYYLGLAKKLSMRDCGMY